MKPLRFAIFGAGFWARAQLAAWREVGGVECVAIYNRSHDKAAAFAVIMASLRFMMTRRSYCVK